jgi:hypothetical protein
MTEMRLDVRKDGCLTWPKLVSLDNLAANKSFNQFVRKLPKKLGDGAVQSRRHEGCLCTIWHMPPEDRPVIVTYKYSQRFKLSKLYTFICFEYEAPR